MKHTQEEIKHYESVSKFFNFQFFISGDYPFFTDDRLLEDYLKVPKNVYRDGKRTKVNLLPASLDDARGLKLFDTDSINKQIEEVEKTHDLFKDFILENWNNLLTTKQRLFILDTLEEKEGKYTKQQRSQYRKQIQNRLREGFLGGANMYNYYIINEIKLKMRMIESFDRVADSKKDYESLIREKIDKDYLNNIVYARISRESRASIVAYILNKKDNIANKALYELNEIFQADLARLKFIDLSMYK